MIASSCTLKIVLSGVIVRVHTCNHYENGPIKSHQSTIKKGIKRKYRIKRTFKIQEDWFGLWCLTPHSTII